MVNTVISQIAYLTDYSMKSLKENLLFIHRRTSGNYLSENAARPQS